MSDELFPDRRLKAHRKRKVDWDDHAAVHAYKKARAAAGVVKPKSGEPKPKHDSKKYHIEYAAKHREHIAAYQRKYRQENKDRLKAKGKKWYKANPKKWNIQNKRYRDKNPDRVIKWYVKSKYGLTPEQLAALGNRCHICDLELERNKKNRPCIDHDHDTGEVRGLLCNKCNFAIGLFRNDVGLLMKAMVYLSKNAEGVA